MGFDDSTRFSGGAVGYISYEYANRVEPTVPLQEYDDLDLPILYFMIADLVVIFDHARQSMTICANVVTGSDVEEPYKNACTRIKETINLLGSHSKLSPASIKDVKKENNLSGNLSKEEFEEQVLKTKELIRSGDVIQTVLSQRFSIPYEAPNINLYRAIRAINPSPYMFILEDNEFSVVGASPEVHVRGRVCEIGSVEAKEYMSVERYSHVMHIVSEVIGKLQPNLNAFDLLRATFPAGTVSGAPKVRAMQIISEFEKMQRNIYAGALGYFGYQGNHDSCIAIRTAVIKDNVLHLQAGAGIVADSIPENEYQETINKASGMLKAIILAESITN